MQRNLAVVLVALLLPLVSGAAHAQGGINLGFDDCGTFGGTLKTSACNSNAGVAMFLFASVLAPATIPQMVAAEGTLDVFVNDASSGSVVPWWQLDATGCRAGAWFASEDFTAGPFNCQDFWQGQALGAAVVDPIQAGAIRVRLRFVAALAQPQPLAPVETYLFRIAILNAKSAGSGACAGCNARTCLQLETVQLDQPAGVGDFLVSAPLDHTRVYFQAPCTIPDPVRNTTWGQVKAQYR